MRIGVLAVFACASVVLAACSGDQDRKSSCGPNLYALTVNGKHKVQISSCAGNLPTSPAPVHAAVGDTIQVRIHGGFSVGYPAPKPADSGVISFSTQTTDLVTLEARASGRTDLTVASPFCERPAACAIFEVIVAN